MRMALIGILAILLTLGSCHSAKQATALSANATSVEKTTPDSAAAPKSSNPAEKKAKRGRRPTRRPAHRQKPQSANVKKSDINELKLKAERGDSVAQTQLGVEYMKGDAVEKDLDKAIEWWTKAAEKGYAEAQYKMGICYHFGFCVKKSRKRAKYWYEQAARQHHKSAASALHIIEDEEKEQ